MIKRSLISLILVTQVVGYHKAYGDEITFIPGGFFAPMYSSRAQANKDIKVASHGAFCKGFRKARQEKQPGCN
jgi:hypothetical protein